MDSFKFFRVLRKASDGENADSVSDWLLESEANVLADAMQRDNPAERYAVCELVFRRWTESAEG